MRRVCCFCESWASGGIESFLTGMLSNMDLTDLEVDIVVTQKLESPFEAQMKECGVTIRQLSGSKTKWISNCIQFWKLLKEKQYDVVHLNAFQGLQLIYLQLAKWAGVPVRIAHSHNNSLRKSPLRWCKMLLHKFGKTCFGRAATLRWSCSRLAAEFMFGKRYAAEVIPNGIDTKRYRFCQEIREQVREELGLTGQFVIGSVGRLSWQKNQIFLMDVLARLIQHQPNCRLLLVGEGELENELKERACQLGISEQVIFFGVTNQLEKLLWAMDAFVFPSLFEGLGIVAIEAQTAGLPLLCSERIPEEVNLTPLFKRGTLAAGADVWANMLLQMESDRREEYSELVRLAGYDVNDVSELILTRYLGK